ncbi:transmembrane protein 131 homolog [Drosophila sulfurigaster albostrigata]|uniref:transmembrane protein 131 homolog n=1 Tax=Drosophila sulfurigaster albostrigata TaxID=89887 RepID=UPI002D21B7D7|nr:transmembrane protein 131 homolog [Drosophila sulfurigaster albostrigata]
MYTNWQATMLLPLLLLIMNSAWGSSSDQQMAGSREKVLSELQEPFIGLEETQTLPPHEPHTREQVELLRHLNFVPPAIDFGKWSVGQTVTQIVTLFNQHSNRTVHLNSVAGPSPVFYSSFFGTRDVPPQGNTTFSVVFLPRQLGAISTGLLIQTSFGRAEYAVRGEGSECPYRLKPLVGIKAPMNATLTPEIHMYNPHERPLQILEVYSSGGEFQLELPSGMSEAPQKLWEIPPHSLKPVIRISFHGRTAGNHSAYIRIKIAEQALDDSTPLEQLNENVLVIPVEFEILPKHGAYASNPVADFGRVATDQHADALHFKLNMQNQHVDAAQRKLIGNYLREIPGLSYDAHNSSIVLDPKLFEQSASINDLLVISSEEQQQQQFTVMVRADIFKGGLHYDRNVTLFITSVDSDEMPLQSQRTLVVRNNFAFPLKIYNLSLSAPIDAALLEMSTLEQELLLQPGESVELLQLQLLNAQAKFNSVLRIESNVTIFELPIVACTGLLHVSTQAFQLQLPRTESAYDLGLDLGTVPFAEQSRQGYIVLRNDNPIPIKVANWHFKPPAKVYFTATFLGCIPADQVVTTEQSAELEANNHTSSFQFCSQLGAGESAVFVLYIQTYVAEESVGTFKLSTPYEMIRIAVKFKASVGQLDIEQEQLQFKSCFPGKMCSAVLSIRSTFTDPVHVTAITFKRQGLRFKDFNAKGTTIGAQTLTKVGRIYFEPSALCRNACYIRPSSNENAIFPKGDAAQHTSNNNLLYDGAEVRQRTELYRQLKRQLHSMSLVLHSKELPPLELDFSIGIEWPKLVQHQPLPPIPAVEVGQVQRQWITISNPTTQPLLLDYFLSDPQYARRTQLSLPHEVIDVSSSSCYLTDQPVFSLPDVTFPGPVLLPAGATLTIPVQFSAQLADKYCTLLHVRSNLTLYEAVWLTARAVQSQFRFGNRRPGSSMPLLFELSSQAFERCDGSSKQSTEEEDTTSHQVSATRSFTARNAGVLPIRIEGFLIGKRHCEDHGFKVIDCNGFELRENETRKVEISYSPDFTAYRVQRTLTLLTNLDYDIQYQLVAQLPAESVERCAATLPRPQWERLLRNAALVVLLASFCLVLLTAILDARAIVAQQNAYDAARYKSPLQPTFNLRNIVKMQLQEDAASAAAAAASSAAALKAEQQQKLRNGQLKERKRATATDKVISSRKPKSWTAWSMDLGSSESKAAAAAVSPPAKQSSSSPKPSKKSSPIAQTPPTVVPATRAPKKAKPVTPPSALPKPKLDSSTVELQEKTKVSPNAKSSPTVAATTPPQQQQQENVSPKPPKSSMETPKERVLKEQNGSAKKLGKTPGRERRKEQKPTQLNGVGGASKKTTEQRKPRIKQLNFNGTPSVTEGNVSPLTTSDMDTMITNPFQTSSGVYLGEVLPSKPLPVLECNTNWAPAENDLGPIGSRKSVQTQPMSMGWDTQMTPETTVSSNVLMNTLFKNPQPPPMNHLGMDLPAINGYGNNWYDQPQRERELQEQQLNEQHQMMLLLKKQQRMMPNLDDSNWPLNATNGAAATGNSWSSLDFGAWPNPSSLRTSPMHTIHPSVGMGYIRPPPGLEHNYNNNNCQFPGVAGVADMQSSAAAAAFIANHSNQSNNNHIDNAQQLPLQQQQQQEERQQMPTQYDPFTSPSSIWSDNWRQRNNHMN